MPTSESGEEQVIVMGPDMCMRVWEIVRSNRAAGKPSMAKLLVNKDGGVVKVIEIRVSRIGGELREDPG